MRYFKLWIEYLKKSLKQWNEYRMDFIFISFASIISLIIGIVNIEIIYTQVDNIMGWNKYEVLWMLGYFYLIQCIFNTFFINCFDVSSFVYNGNLDLLKTRPISVVFQLLFSERYNIEFPIDQFVMGVFLLIWSGNKLTIVWNFINVLYFVVAVIFSVIIYTCIIFAISSMSLWTVKNNYFVEFIFELEELNQYPINVYGKGFCFLLTYVLPIGFVSFYPNQVLLGHKEFFSLSFLSPVVAIILLSLTILIWKLGLNRYQSPNS